MYTYTTIREIVDKLNLEILNEGNLDLKIDIPNIYQIGYELVGFLDKESDELNKYINFLFHSSGFYSKMICYIYITTFYIF